MNIAFHVWYVKHMWNGRVIPHRTQNPAVSWNSTSAKNSVGSMQYEARVAKHKPNIVWKNAPAGTSHARTVFPARYKKPRHIDEIDPSMFIIGVPVIAARPLTAASEKGVYSMLPLEPFKGPDDEAPIHEGSLLMYSGPVYETERCVINGKKLDAAVIKHTFITPLGRCIIHDFSLIRME